MRPRLAVTVHKVHGTIESDPVPYSARIPADLNFADHIHLENAGIPIVMKKRLQLATSGNERDNSSPKEAPSRHGSLLFPIVGIGASAGGLEALEQFLRH